MPRTLTALLLLTLALPGQVVINEFNTGTPDWLELRNQGAVAVDVSGYSVETFQASSGVPRSEGRFVIPAGTVIPAGGTLVLEESGTPGATGSFGPCSMRVGIGYLWTSTRSVAILLRDASFGFLDHVYRQGPGGTPATSAGAPGLPAGQVWVGAFTQTGNACARTGDVDTDAATDWTAAAAPSVCALNPGQSIAAPVTLVAGTQGQGDVSLSIGTTPARPQAEYYNLVSLQDYPLNGTGPVFGVGLDALFVLGLPLQPGSPFHGRLDGMGRFAFVGGPGTVAQGIVVEVVTVVIDPTTGQVSSSPVVQVDF